MPVQRLYGECIKKIMVFVVDIYSRRSWAGRPRGAWRQVRRQPTARTVTAGPCGGSSCRRRNAGRPGSRARPSARVVVPRGRGLHGRCSLYSRTASRAPPVPARLRRIIFAPGVLRAPLESVKKFSRSYSWNSPGRVRRSARRFAHRARETKRLTSTKMIARANDDRRMSGIMAGEK